MGPPWSIRWVESLKITSQTQSHKRHLIHLTQDFSRLQITSASAEKWKSKLIHTLTPAQPHQTHHTQSSFLLHACVTCMAITLWRSILYFHARLELNALELGPFAQAKILLLHRNSFPMIRNSGDGQLSLRKGDPDIKPAFFWRNLHEKHPINKSGSIILYQNNILALMSATANTERLHYELLFSPSQHFLISCYGGSGMRSLIWIRNTLNLLCTLSANIFWHSSIGWDSVCETTGGGEKCRSWF